MLDRRYFFKALTAGGIGLFVRGSGSQSIAATTGGILNPDRVNKFQTPLLIPPVMPRAGRIQQTQGNNVDYYEISLKQFRQ